jgi:hypothetical protein
MTRNAMPSVRGWETPEALVADLVRRGYGERNRLRHIVEGIPTNEGRGRRRKKPDVARLRLALVMLMSIVPAARDAYRPRRGSGRPRFADRRFARAVLMWAGVSHWDSRYVEGLFSTEARPRNRALF